MLVDSKRSAFKDYMGTQRKIHYEPGAPTADAIWTRTWLPQLYTDDKKRLLILGDAITEGMSFYYEELLGAEWSVHRQTGSVPVTSELYFARLRFALNAARKKYDVICFTTPVLGDEAPNDYGKALRKAADMIKEYQPQARVVLVAHTMADVAAVGKNTNIRIYGYNRALEVLAVETGAEFVDLGVISERLSADRAENGVAFTDAGYKKLTFEVVKKIK